jgi:uncharacterized protein (TIGR02117 family)
MNISTGKSALVVLPYFIFAIRWLLMVFVFGLVCYSVFALVSAVIPISEEDVVFPKDSAFYEVYLLKSGPHTDFLVPVKNDIHDWSADFPFANNANPDTTLSWLAIGWGDKNFYMNTPTWADLTLRTAVAAATGLGTAGIHASYYFSVPNDRPIIRLQLTQNQYMRLCAYVSRSLVADENGKRIMLQPLLAGVNFEFDRYYDAHGRYSMIHTCNTWINNGLKASGQRACLWTGFAEGIFYQYDM